MASHWSEQRERSNPFWLVLMAWLAVHLGRGFLRVLCVPIAGFFLLTATQPRRASREYLARVLDRAPNWRDTFRHFYTFALVSGDRLLFLSGLVDKFQLRFHGEQLLLDYAQQQRGCLLLVSHLGSFDAMRVPGVEDNNIPIRILIDKQHNPAAIQLVEQLNPELAQGMIDAGRPSAELVLALDECLRQGDMVGIMADRAGVDEQLKTLPFLDGEAQFPMGPWLLALVLKVPVVLCFAVYQGQNRYSVHFEQVADGEPVPRRERQQAIATHMARYVDRLEHYTRSAPYNWFNFYNFWTDESTTDN